MNKDLIDSITIKEVKLPMKFIDRTLSVGNISLSIILLRISSVVKFIDRFT